MGVDRKGYEECERETNLALARATNARPKHREARIFGPNQPKWCLKNVCCCTTSRNPSNLTGTARKTRRAHYFLKESVNTNVSGTCRLRKKGCLINYQVGLDCAGLWSYSSMPTFHSLHISSYRAVDLCNTLNPEWFGSVLAHFEVGFLT